MQARFEIERMQREKQRLEDALESMNDEIRAAGVELFERQGLIDRVERDLKKIAESVSDDALRLVKRLQKEVRKSKEELNRRQGLLKYWALIDRDFLKCLANFCPELNGQELIICALTVNGMKAKEIADLKHGEERAVEQARRRIRIELAKYGLEPGEDLGAFLARI
jgi:hypothetical protein